MLAWMSAAARDTTPGSSPNAAPAGIDISANFIRHAREWEEANPSGIHYYVASAVELPFGDATFDFVSAFMSLMDIPETDLVLAEVFRALKPGGFFQFSITHPCFDTPHRESLRDAEGLTYAIEVGDYFRRIDGEVKEWLFSAAPPDVRAGLRPFRIPLFTKTLSEWLNLLISSGFVIERLEEPRPSDETAREWPGLQDAQVVACFLHVRVRKPA